MITEEHRKMAEILRYVEATERRKKKQQDEAIESRRRKREARSGGKAKD